MGSAPLDVILTAGRVDTGDPRQHARDASVHLRGFGATAILDCSAVLVSPRVVLTNEHCVREALSTTFTEVPWVELSPQNSTGIVGEVTPGAPMPVRVHISTCTIHPEIGASCFDGGSGGDGAHENDVAVLVLDQRLDDSLESAYRVTPARVLTFGPREGMPVRLSGYGRRGLFADSGVDRMRRAGDTSISSLQIRTVLTAVEQGFAGDSGGPIFLNDMVEDGSPLRLLALKSGGLGTQDIGQRLDIPGTQAFLSTFLGASGEAYPGVMVPLPGGAEVWTGPPDLPRRGQPGRTEVMDALDPDADGLIGRHDNCWGFYNPMQHVTDPTTLTRTCTNDFTGATFSIGCAPRPTTFPGSGPGEEGTNDADHDGVWDLCDGCRDDYDPDQADCNRDAMLAINRERAEDDMPPLELLGDACDPTPCASMEIVAETETPGTFVRRTTTRFDRLDVDGLMAGDSRDAVTGFRFCRCDYAYVDNEEARRLCTQAPTSDGYQRGCVLADPPSYDETSETLPWRFVSMTPASGTFTPTLPLRFEREILHSPVSPPDVPPTADWDTRLRLLADDLPRWERLPLAARPETFPREPGTTAPRPLPGVLWSHTRAFAGDAQFDEPVREQTNHYLSLPFRPPFSSVPALRRFMFPLPPIARGWNWYGRRPFLVRDTRTGAVSALLGNALIPAVDDSEAAQYARFASGDRWLSVAEPSSQLRGTVLRYVTLSSGGVGTKIGEVNGAFVDLGEPQCAPGQCPPTDGPPLAALGDSAPPPFDPSTEVAVLSATRNMLWVLRGETPDAAATLAAYDLVGDEWRAVTMPDVGEVLAATYSARDEVLWVLDQVEVDRRRYARLLAVVPESGYATESVRWRRVTRHDRFDLAMTSSGRELYLAAGFGGAHAVARLDVSFDTVRLRGVRLGVGRLPTGTTVLRADSRGVSVLTDHALGLEVVDHPRASFATGGMASCL